MKNLKKEPSKNKIETYLSFELNNEEFGVNVKNVINILEMKKITEVPKSPDYFKGIINLRGTALPVVDLRIILGISQLEFTNNTCILVLQLEIDSQEITFGAIVDSVKEVLKVNLDQIEPAPNLGSKYQSGFIYGMWKIEENFIMLLDIENVLNSEQISVIKEADVTA